MQSHGDGAILSSLPAGPVSEPAAARAYRAMERMIVTLELAPGAVTTEGALISRLQLGRTPVREAIQRLAWEGLIEVRPRAGLAIANLHVSDWLRVIEARRGIEIVLARAAARFAGGLAVEAFRAAALDMHEAVALADAAAFLEADKALDEAMVMAADNPFAARVAAPLQTHSRRFWFRYRARSDLGAPADRHVALIDAVLDGCEAAAEARASDLMDLLEGHAREAALR